MNRAPYEVGDFRLKSLSISTNDDKGVVVSVDQVAAIDIYEDLTKPTVYAELVLLDSIGLIEKLPIIGEEKVEIEVETPGISSSATFKFRCFKVSNIHPLDTSKGVTYFLHCVSEEHLRNSHVKRDFMTGLVSDMVERIVTRDLATEKPFFFDATKGIERLVFPNLKPLASIDFLRQRAVGAEDPESPYVFFENQYGFNFSTLKGLFKKGLPKVESENRVFNYQQNPMSSPEQQAASFRTLLSYQTVYSGETARNLSKGVYKNVTGVFDIATKKFETQEFILQDKFGSLAADTTKTIPNTSEWIDTFGSEVQRRFLSVKDGSKPQVFFNNIIGAKNSFVLLMNSDITRVKVPGDTGLAVGQVVKLEMPILEGTTGRKNFDEVTTGSYLILRLRHMFTLTEKLKHFIVFDCAQIGR
jgi:hypothetical protein